MFGEPETVIGKFLGGIGFILGALSITYTLTRISNRFLRKKYPFKKAAITSFIIVSMLTMFISSCVKFVMYDSFELWLIGMVKTFMIYIPCLIIWLILDIKWANMLTLEEAAGLLKLDIHFLEKYAKSGAIPAKKRGKEWRFYKNGIVDWLKENKRPRDNE